MGACRVQIPAFPLKTQRGTSLNRRDPYHLRQESHSNKAVLEAVTHKVLRCNFAITCF